MHSLKKTALAILARNGGNIRNVLLQGARVAAGLAAMRLAALIVSALVARVMGVEALGEYTFFLTLCVITAEVLYAFDLAYIREAGLARNAGHQRQYLRWAVVGKIACVTVLTLLMVVCSDTVSTLLGKESAGNLVKWAVIAGSMNALFMSVTARYQQRQRFSVVSLLQPLPNVLVLVGVVAAAGIGHLRGISDVTRIYVGVGILVGFAGLAYVAVAERGSRGDPQEDTLAPRIIRKYLVTAAGLLLAKALSLLSIRLDVFFLGKWLSYEDLGLYGVALRVSVLVSLITAVTGTLVLPRAAEAMADAGRFRRYLGLAGLYIGLQTIAAVLLLFFARPIIGLVFGAEYEAAAWITGLLLLQALFTAYGGPFQALMQCGMRPSLSIMIAGFRLVISVPLLWYAVPEYGVEGAAVVVTLVAIIVSTIQFGIVWRRRPRVS